ncbi:MAG TPA: SDR family oxidoreductase [Solirubrobacteraceae bacterium]|nr:SDR family oxidoreductase [Solirubrobacteraceae bacterium]
MSAAEGKVLLTGATGFVGMELLHRYLEQGDRQIVTLIRAKNDAAARARLDAVLANLFGRRADRHARRVEAVAAELTAPGLALDARRRERLASEVTTIVHSAASVSFALPLEEARAINLEGTRRMLDFASLAMERGGLQRYGHVSTAYVAGTHQGVFHECDHDRGQGFHNSYEQSKFEAEQLVRSTGELPYTILRPSIVVGDRRSGWTAAFNVLYWPLRAFARGLFEAVPAVPSAPVDVVSIDYVADAIHELCEGPYGVGETYHLTAGASASTIAEIAQMASGYFRRPLPQVLSPAEFAARECSDVSRRALEGSSVYFPYFSIGAVFDETQTRARLAPAGIEVTPLREYIVRLLDFATLSRWGKNPISRYVALAA